MYQFHLLRITQNLTYLIVVVTHDSFFVRQHQHHNRVRIHFDHQHHNSQFEAQDRVRKDAQNFRQFTDR